MNAALKQIALAMVAVEVAVAAETTGRRIVVNIPDRKVTLIVNGQVVKVYGAAVGAEKSPTPAGEFTIIHKIPEPTWWGPRQVVGPGKANPLGTRWLGLSLKGYGIHGTNAPKSIGRAASHGCIRLRNSDVEELFAKVAIGDTVVIEDRTGAGPALDAPQ